MIGTICFNHGKKVVALIIGKNFEIHDELEIEISNNGQSEESSYIRDFGKLHDWLIKYQDLRHLYVGPRLTGIVPKYLAKFQGAVHEPASDSRAFLETIKSFKNSVRACGVSQAKINAFPESKAALEVCYMIPGQNVEKLKCCYIGARSLFNCKYKEVSSLLKESDDYKEKKWLIDNMLPKSQRKRIGYTALQKAVFMWNNPDSKRQKIKDLILNEAKRSLSSPMTELRI